MVSFNFLRKLSGVSVVNQNTHSGDQYQFIFLRRHQHENDFRFALAEALFELGMEVTYIYLYKKPVIYELGGGNNPVALSRPMFREYIKQRFSGKDNLVVFNSADLEKVRLCFLLRRRLRGIWCFDVHDDLLYEKKGWSWVAAKVRQKILVALSDIQVCAAPNLVELIPTARHLGNASNVARIERGPIDWSKVLVMSSIDARFDFEFLRLAAEQLPATEFCVFGYVGSEAIQANINRITKACPNVTFRGPYKNSDIPEIMASFGVMLAPYAINYLTKYIDPLRFYHGLRSGMEVVSTPIPAARTMADLIHVVDDPVSCAASLRAIAENSDARKNRPGSRTLSSWCDKAKDLLQILADRSAG